MLGVPFCEVGGYPGGGVGVLEFWLGFIWFLEK